MFALASHCFGCASFWTLAIVASMSIQLLDVNSCKGLTFGRWTKHRLSQLERVRFKHKQELTCLLSGLQLTAYMLPLWPSSMDNSPSLFPVFPSYIVPFLPELTVMNLLPSGENLTQLTKFVWSLQIQNVFYDNLNKEMETYSTQNISFMLKLDPIFKSKELTIDNAVIWYSWILIIYYINYNKVIFVQTMQKLLNLHHVYL